MRAKWIAGLVTLSLISAIIASVLTAAVLLNGSKLQANTGTSSLPDNTTSGSETGNSPTPSPVTSPTPTLKPTPKPTSPVTDPTIPTTVETDTTEPTTIWETSRLLEKIYSDVSPAVVCIQVEVGDPSSTAYKTNIGSGLIISTEGDIVTNTSILGIALDKQGKVLSNASIKVLIQGASVPFTATLTGRDQLTGLAALSIKPGYLTLKPAVFAEEPELKVGQLILAVGYPDLQYKTGGLSSGMICGLNRSTALEDGTVLQMIQTDARISQNCSGGPLLNLEGEVIGLTNNTLARESIDAMSYALPGGTVKSVAESLIDNGFVSGRSWLGVSVLLEDSFLELQKLYLLPDGLYISSVIKDSPAYTGDLRKGDVITEINGDAVETSMDMSRFLQSQPIGTLVTIRVYRRSDRQYHEIKVYLQEYKH